MKILSALALILSPWSLIHPSTTTLSVEERHIDRICTYHASLLTDSTDQMLRGNGYAEAFDYAITRFETETDQQYLAEIEEALNTITAEETQMIGKVTGLASIVWYSVIKNGSVTATYENLYYQSYARCVQGSLENGVVRHFEMYEEAIERLEKKVNPPT